MPILNISGFLGANKAIHPMLLGQGIGVNSVNQKPGRNDLRPWRVPLQVATVPAGAATIYRMGRDVASDTQYWLSWSTVVHAARGFEADDTTERTYYTGDGTPKVTNNVIGLATAPYPTASRPLGIPAPVTKPTMSSVTGTGTGTESSIYYVYTYVNDWGWEGAPSPVSDVVVMKPGQSVSLTAITAPPSGNYNINRARIYRTMTGSSGATSFFFFKEIALGGVPVVDNGTTTLGEVLPTTTYLVPPDDLSFLTPLWNGMMAGISGNSVRFSEPYISYAWPIAYDVIPPDSKPVALGVFGQSLLVLTTGRPILVAGSGPDSMDQIRLEIPQACCAPQSTVSMGSGVAWASEDGLCWYGAGGSRVLTAGDPERGIPPAMTREDWQALKPRTIIGKMYEGLYFGSYDDGSGRKGFFINPSNPTGIYFLSSGYTAMHFDELQDQFYVLDGVNVKRWDAGSTFLSCTFKGKVERQPVPVNFAAAKVVADGYPVHVNIYAGENLVYSVDVPSMQEFRLPSGFTETNWQVEIQTSYPVQGIALATSVEELAV